MMSLVYWFSDGGGEDMTTGGARRNTPIPTLLVRRIRTKGSPSLIVYGGDIYPSGSSRSFSEFLAQMDGDVSLMCETPGNHDWEDDPVVPGSGRIPHGYDTFWRAHPESKQPVDTAKTGGARFEHFIDIDGWRLLFLDTGDYKKLAWPAGDPARVTWLQSNLQPGRSNIVMAHHSRVSRGRHGNHDRLDGLWRALFDDRAKPRVAFTLAGHDHNVSSYSPRSMSEPTKPAASPADGIHVFVNGAGGEGHVSQGFFASGTKPDVLDDDEHFCVTRINLIDPRSADVDVLSFGTHADAEPISLAGSLVKIRV